MLFFTGKHIHANTLIKAISECFLYHSFSVPQTSFQHHSLAISFYPIHFKTMCCCCHFAQPTPISAFIPVAVVVVTVLAVVGVVRFCLPTE